jgi:nicotinamide phosphoribosyltransferase
MSGVEAACLSGAAHLLSFTGTDTIPAIDFLEEYYNADSDLELIGGSVPATEHSVCSLGTQEGEFNTFQRLITEIYPAGIVSLVSDTWDFWKVVTEYLPTLKGEIMARDGRVVCRPDSGDPVKIVTGDDSAPAGSPEQRGAVECLWNTFGGTYTKGYRRLDSHIGLIYGDSITIERQEQILGRLQKKGFSSDNVVLGIGSFSYQHVTRDTFGFAVKATYGEVNGEPREIYKTPKTDGGEKHSARGLLRVQDGVLIDRVSWDEEEGGDLEDVFVDSRLMRDESLFDIRQRVCGTFVAV